MSIFGIPPGPFRAVEAGGPGGVFVDALFARGVERHHHIPLAAIVHHGPQVRIKVGGVADLRAEHVEILVVHDAHQAFMTRQVLDLHLAHEDRAVEIDHVVAVKGQAQVAVVEADAGGEGVA